MSPSKHRNEYRNALITGASSGLGRGLASFFALRGVRVYAAARRTDALKELQAELSAKGARVEPVTLDVSDVASTLTRIRELDAESGGLDLVIANAGVGGNSNGRQLDWSLVERILAVNVNGAAATLCAALPMMLERRRGHLVGVSSLAGYRGMPKAAAYSASKAFLTTFLEGLRVDLRNSGVHVTAIAPGFVKSELTAQRASRGGKMPFLMETEDACERMGKAILRQASEYRFPWQVSAAVRVLSALPNRAFDPLVQRRR